MQLSEVEYLSKIVAFMDIRMLLKKCSSCREPIQIYC